MIIKKLDTLDKDLLISIRNQLGYSTKRSFADILTIDENLYCDAERGTDKNNNVSQRVIDFCYYICQVPNITETSLKDSIFSNYNAAIREYILSKLELASLMGTKKYTKDSKEFLLTLKNYLDSRDKLVLLTMQFVDDSVIFGQERSPNSIKEISSLLEELLNSNLSESSKEEDDFWKEF